MRAGTSEGPDALAGVRVLVVEDVALLSWMAEMILLSFGCRIAGCPATVTEAIALVDTTPIDIALLDISLREGESFPVADALARKGIPYVFVTAHGRDRIADAHANAPLIGKPYDPSSLRAGLLAGLDLETAA